MKKNGIFFVFFFSLFSLCFVRLFLQLVTSFFSSALFSFFVISPRTFKNPFSFSLERLSSRSNSHRKKSHKRRKEQKKRERFFSHHIFFPSPAKARSVRPLELELDDDLPPCKPPPVQRRPGPLRRRRVAHPHVDEAPRRDPVDEDVFDDL